MKMPECFAVNKHNLKHGHYYCPIYSDKELSFTEISLDVRRRRGLPIYQAVIENSEIKLVEVI